MKPLKIDNLIAGLDDQHCMDHENHPRALAKLSHSPLLEERRKQGGMFKPLGNNPPLNSRKAICNVPVGHDQTNVGLPIIHNHEFNGFATLPLPTSELPSFHPVYHGKIP